MRRILIGAVRTYRTRQQLKKIDLPFNHLTHSPIHNLYKAQADMVAVNRTALLSTLITANHILDYNSVLDGLGHISVRNPLNASTLSMTGKRPPALVTSAKDLAEYYISDGSPVSATDMRTAGSQYYERYIH